MRQYGAKQSVARTHTWQGPYHGRLGPSDGRAGPSRGPAGPLRGHPRGGPDRQNCPLDGPPASVDRTQITLSRRAWVRNDRYSVAARRTAAICCTTITSRAIDRARDIAAPMQSTMNRAPSPRDAHSRAHLDREPTRRRARALRATHSASRLRTRSRFADR